ncbi:Alginate lyase [Lacunisphaera limnophila]|uniref:Alginate lyase n=1 Tax=Lacunisphaera limnophila TaxID=1838286 RepID=A0A1D8AV44_9BACT|nr:alginate lyase family protein [Lacunisphaera limnophila]AOS44774.1 Alginate lyase [Lacunisphaera limnophila]
MPLRALSRFMKSVLLAVLFLGSLGLAGAAMTFVHPGALNSREELNFVKAQIQAGAEPWKGEFERIKAGRYAHMGPHALTHIDSKSEDANVSRYDAAAAYSQALLWYFTGDEAYARSAVAILNAWSNLQGFTAGTQQDRLQAGWIGAVFAPAAEIMRLYSGWSVGEIAAFQAMFRRAFYPQLTTASTWNGNIDLTQIDAMLAIAVFNEDEVLFRQGLERLRVRSAAYFYLTSDGPRPRPIAGDHGDPEKFWSHPRRWVDGLTQETCRDNGHHTQFALGSALHAAETAWHQGVDVYTEHQQRYVAAMELLAGQFLSGSLDGLAANDVASRERFNTWEVGYHHYHGRMGLDLPNTRRLIVEQIRTDSIRAIWNLNYETLTHAELPGDL